MDWKNELERTQIEQPAGSVNWDEELQGRRRGGATGSFEDTGILKDEGEMLLEQMKNIPGSFAKNVELLIAPILHPVQTVKSLGALATGIVAKAIPGEQKSEKAVDALAQFFKERYGTFDNLRNTCVEDPMGVIWDITSIIYPAGKATQMAGIAGKMPRLAQTGKAIAQAGAAIEPVSVAARTAAAPVRIGLKVFKQTPSRAFNCFISGMSSSRLSLAALAIDF